MQPALIVICGATATGKSDLALQLAERLQAPILSADSRQVYQDFDIGTAKPSPADRDRVPHYLLDLYPPTAVATVADYQSLAQAVIADFHHQGVIPLLVGGTGLYIQSVVEGLKIPRVSPQPDLRSQLSALSQSERYQWLTALDPTSASRIHPNDATRSLRALEVFYATGVPLSAQQGRHPPSYPILQLGLEIPGEDFSLRIERRTQHMIAQGWIEEVAHLIKTYGEALPLLNTLGYAELKAYLGGKQSLPEAVSQIVLHTRQFAKRQRTWFRANPNIQWFNALHPDLLTQTWAAIQAFVASECKAVLR